VKLLSKWKFLENRSNAKSHSLVNGITEIFPRFLLFLQILIKSGKIAVHKTLLGDLSSIKIGAVKAIIYAWRK